MLYNRCTGIYKFGNNTYPQCIRHRSNLGHIFRGKSAPYGPGYTVTFWRNVNTVHSHMVQKPQNRTGINNKSPRKLKPATSLSVTNFVT